MTRATQCRSTALCACLAALALFAPASAGAAGPSAVEEYTLTLPGVGKAGEAAPAPVVDKVDRVGSIGVVGEQDDSFTPLAAVSSAIVSPAGIAVIVLAAGGIALAAPRRGART